MYKGTQSKDAGKKPTEASTQDGPSGVPLCVAASECGQDLTCSQWAELDGNDRMELKD